MFEKVLAYVAVINLLTAYCYWKDKRAARYGGWRISEKFLHTLALMGGSPAALVASKVLRHKNRKNSFKVVLWFTAFFQICIFVVLYSEYR